MKKNGYIIIIFSVVNLSRFSVNAGTGTMRPSAVVEQETQWNNSF
jgi:hypothetical protein